VAVVEVNGPRMPQYPDLRVGFPASGTLDAIFQSFKPDVVHLAGPAVFGARVARAAQRWGVPVVAIFQTDLAGFALHYGAPDLVARQIWRALRWVHDYTDLTLAPTPSVADEISHHGIAPVKVWGRGVDAVQFHPERRSEELRHQWGLSDGRIAVGFVGRLAAEKQVDRLTALCGRADLQMVVVGDGPRRAHLEQQMPDAVFTGELHGEELGQAMASLDVFVHTGEHETFCQTVQEAMAAQVAAVAPASGGPVDLIDSGTTGMLYRPGDTADLVATVEKLVADPAGRSRMAAAGHRSVADRTWSAIGDQILEHYRWAMSGNGGPNRRVSDAAARPGGKS
jgi:phosphatidylinositol alpha 1,6-mannosyltransferase